VLPTSEKKYCRKPSILIPGKLPVFIALLTVAFTFCTGESPRASVPSEIMVSPSTAGSGTSINKIIPPGLQYLKESYPGFVARVTADSLILVDGTKMVWDEGIVKNSFGELLDKASLKDMMSQRYVKGKDYEVPIPENFDPGRIRHEAFFYAMYGKTKADVLSNLVTIDWFGRKLRVSRINGVNKRLDSVKAELQQLPERFHKYFTKTAGSFNWRNIAGTERRSAHSFGIAIDLNTEYSNYWRWEKPDGNGKYGYRNRMPLEIVQVFEKYGFIWGGKWYHFDTMHFEYRPELLLP